MCVTTVGTFTGPALQRSLRMEGWRECFRRAVAILDDNFQKEERAMLKGLVITILTGVIFFAACSDPAADKTKAVTGEAAQVASPAAAQGQKYLISPQNCKIEFTASKVTGSL